MMNSKIVTSVRQIKRFGIKKTGSRKQRLVFKRSIAFMNVKIAAGVHMLQNVKEAPAIELCNLIPN